MVGFDELARGYWEAKDEHDDLAKEVKAKFAIGYPKDNIIFQSPARAILYQNGRQVLDEDITRPEALVGTLKQFFEYRAPQIAKWEEAAAKFQERVPELAESVIKLIERERKTNKKFIAAFADFSNIARASINPNISDVTVEEMLIQHLLTERIFRNVFDNPDFANNNIIAVEIEKVIRVLTSQTFSRAEFLKSNDYFYRALEETAATIDDFSQKQSFLNSVYERFFQGFSVKIADTHGIVYTPQPIVNFMVKSVEDILQQEFSKSLGDAGVHVLDPFVGTGNFMIRVMQEIKRTRLQEKYASELHCNEVMLLPYYIASMNIEHTFYDITNTYQPFEGICFVDTFELAESRQGGLFTEENTARIEKQKRQKLFVIIGNPPYNAKQEREDDNNKNRKYPAIDKRIAETYIKDSKATLRNKLRDPYVRAIRLATDKIAENGEGIIALVTNNSFMDETQFDGMRKHLVGDFSKIIHINLKGNARTTGERRRQEGGNIFSDLVRVGIGITFFIKKHDEQEMPANILVHDVDDYLKEKEKTKFLVDASSYLNVNFEKAELNNKNAFVYGNADNDFALLLPLGTKEAKRNSKGVADVVFKNYTLGISSNRDAVVYDFNEQDLANRVERFCDDYNAEVVRYRLKGKPKDIDSFLNKDTIKWSRNLKRDLRSGKFLTFDASHIRVSLYRPYTKRFLYFDHIIIDERGQVDRLFPNMDTENENRAIAITGHAQTAFIVQMLSCIPCLDVGGRPTQCFPLYTYNEDGTNRRENITDWALAQFHTQYNIKSISKLDIFHYVYALLHHPTYRATYAANLKRELPRIPFVTSPEDFRVFVKAGQRLADLHVNYESQPEYKLEHVENKDAALDWRVERMKLSKDKTSIVYNDFLTLEGIPPEAFEYRLGNRSALEWIIDQYQVSTDKRSGITNDPNRADEPDYIVKLICKVTTVSVDTVKIVSNLPALQL